MAPPGIESFEEMSNLSRTCARGWPERFVLTVPQVVRRQVSRVDARSNTCGACGTGDCVESVLMHYEHGM